MFLNKYSGIDRADTGKYLSFFKKPPRNLKPLSKITVSKAISVKPSTSMVKRKGAMLFNPSKKKKWMQRSVGSLESLFQKTKI